MTTKYKIILCLVAFFQVVGLCLLFLGVVGSFDDSIVTTPDNSHGVEDSPKNSSVIGEIKLELELELEIPKKVVLMVIDALRVDMMTPKNFPFLLGSLQNYKKSRVLEFKVTVDSPTVTLPRIKTLLTGKSPTFLDILKNFQTSDIAYASTQINQDNVISILKQKKPKVKVCFFGDETWLRLFPTDKDGNSQYFWKWEGVTSFFVKDFEEVDKNVTRNLDKIGDCNFLILHYLGLDHIGHVYGPTERPDLIRKKLNEMDKVIKKLYTQLSKTGPAKSVLMITGDHGMANAGGHGGSSFEEITTPLVTVITNVQRLKNQKPVYPLIHQVDLAPTLSSFWDLKVPQDSTGQLILDIIEPIQSSQQLANNYQDNCEHLLKVLGNSREASTYRLWLNEISQMKKPLSITKYIELEHELGDAIRNAKSDSHNFSGSFLSGFLIIILTEAFIVLYLLQNISTGWTGQEVALFMSFIPPLLIYFSSSFIEEEHYIRYFIFSCIILHLYTFSSANDPMCFWSIVKILACHRVAMCFNQTGDKWNHLRDFNDVINEENLAWLSAIIGTMLVRHFLKQSDRSSRTLDFTLAFIYLSKTVSKYSGIMEQWPLSLFAEHQIQQVSYLLILGNFLLEIRQRSLKTSVFITMLLLVFNLQRLQNIIVIGLLLVELSELISFFHYQHVLKTELRKDKPIQAELLSQVAFVWFVHATFFYQGNSNGLATVDVSAGYIGFGSFSSSFLIGVLIFLHTYGYPVIVYIHFLTIRGDNTEFSREDRGIDVCKNGKMRHKKSELTISNPLPVISLLSNGAEGIIYAATIVLFRNHLFIWSVFVPKLMYLIMQSVMHFMLALIYLVL